MKKRVAVLLCVTVLASVLCACGSNSKSKDDKKTSDAAKVEATTEEVVKEVAKEATTEAVKEVTTEATTQAATEATKTDATPADTKNEEIATPVVGDPEDGTTLDSVYAGQWHEKVAGRGMMTVTLDGETVNFAVTWADSAYKTYTWTFSGKQNEAGIIYYSNCLKESAEYDEEGNGTKEVITDAGKGSVEVTVDGTMLWTEDGEVHEFVRN